MARIFYIGELWDGSTCLDRMRALQQLGHEVIGFNTTSYQAKWRIFRSIAHRFNLGLSIFKLNKSIIEIAQSIGKLDVVWIDKGKWVFPKTLNLLKKITQCKKLIHYTPDYQLTSNKSRYFRAGIKLYDLLVTTKRAEIGLYHSLGAKNILFVYQSYDPDRFKPGPKDKSLESEVCFIGHYELHYLNILKKLNSLKIKVIIKGPGWHRRKRLLPAYWSVSGPVWGEGYPRCLRSTNIALALLSRYAKEIPDSHTTRSVEIPACGVFMLGERTVDHQELFDEGKEAEFFENTEELLDKIQFYLTHDEVRKRVARAGYEKIQRLGLRNIDVVDRILSHKIK